jgi:hypothetical protein
MILPIGLGNTNQLPNHNAFFGDKRLNMHIALLLRTYKDGTLDNNSDNDGDSGTIHSDDDANNDSDNSMTSLEKFENGSPHLPSVGSITYIQSVAMSNQLFASYISQILPYHMTIKEGNGVDTYDEMIQKNSQIHDAGTMIEAAVDYVANLLSSSPSMAHNNNNNSTDGNVHADESENEFPIVTPEIIDTALTELAQFLIDKARTYQSYSSAQMEGSDQAVTLSTPDLHNPKGELLNHGGRMTCKRLDGYPDHAPQFTATAHIDDLTSTVYHGRNRRESEHSAAAMLWRYYSKYVLPHKNNAPIVVGGDSDDIENPKGRILSIGGQVTSEKLPGHPDHLPRFRAVCNKPFFIIQPLQPNNSADSDDENENEDDDSQPSPKLKLKYMIEATAEGRTRYEAERIASVIVWKHVMSMKTIPTSNDEVTKLVPYVTKDINTKKLDTNDGQERWFGDMDENDPLYDDVDPNVPEPVEPKLSAKKRRRLRTLKNATVRHVSKYDIRHDQDNFLHFQLTDHERPHINLRPGGETVIESWYRGALNPLAAFHRALIAPHVFPNHIATVNAFTRHNIIPDDTLNVKPTEEPPEEVFIDHRKKFNEADGSLDPTDVEDSVPDKTPTPSLITEIITTASSLVSPISSDSGATADESPFNDPRIEVAVRRDQKYKRTFTVLAFVVPNIQHPLLANMDISDYNTNELLTKCFVEQGYNVRETRNAIGIKINQYIIDVLLKDFADLDETVEKARMEAERRRNLRDRLSRQERMNTFFRF